MAPTAEPMGIPCPVPVNSGPQHHYVAQAAIAHLDRWARGGPPPPSSPRLETDPDDPMRLVTDDAGIARGGIRTGWVDAPVAALSGLTPPGAAGIGILLGSTRVFDPAELARRYPAGPGEYAAAFGAATARGGRGFPAGPGRRGDDRRRHRRLPGALTGWLTRLKLGQFVVLNHLRLRR